jgi:hypothetical protein
VELAKEEAGRGQSLSERDDILRSKMSAQRLL